MSQLRTSSTEGHLSPLILSTWCISAQKEASIVTPLAGTTRDVIELSLDFHGYPIMISDTAGLRETSDEIEKIGVERARRV